jgi:hypothetical protein
MAAAYQFAAATSKLKLPEPESAGTPRDGASVQRFKTQKMSQGNSHPQTTSASGPRIFLWRVFKKVARASRPSNPASRRISPANVNRGGLDEYEIVGRLTTVLSATLETTGRRPVPPQRPPVAWSIKNNPPCILRHGLLKKRS